MSQPGLLIRLERGLRRSEAAKSLYRVALRAARRFRDNGYSVPLPTRPSSWDRGHLVVSLTTFPARIRYVAMAIESIQRGSLRPHLIVLVLAKSQFRDRRLPWRLRIQALRSNVNILWTDEDSKSYKKLLPTIEAFPNSHIVTIDDDVIYERRFLQGLVDATDPRRKRIVGYRGWELQLDSGQLASYRGLPEATRSSPPERVLLTGVGGILYPPHALRTDALMDPAWRTVSPTADDIWFWAVAHVSGVKPVCLWEGREPYRTIDALRVTPSLSIVNNHQAGNDIQMRRVIDHFGLEEALGLTGSLLRPTQP
jgi:hypothetical protein